MRKLSIAGLKGKKFFEYIRICEKTGLQSSDGKDVGKYKFYINSTNDEVKWTDKYIFDGEYLILNTGGQAYTNYVNNKFSAMSDCLVLKPLEKSMSLYYWLKSNEKRINDIGFQGTGLKHLDLKWLLRQNVIIINYDEKKLFNLNMCLDKIIELNSLLLDKLLIVKKQLLNSLFI